MTKPKYKHPSLVEAVFEMKFPTDSKWGMSSFINFAKAAEKAGYSQVIDVAEGFQVNIQTKDGVASPEVIPVSRRIQTWNPERDQLWQASAEMFAANRRAPYLGWEKFRPHILKGWKEYAKLAKPKRAVQIALHYVNDIPFSVAEPPETFVKLVPPEISYAEVKKNFNCSVIESYKNGDVIQVSSSRNIDSSELSVVLNIIYIKKAPSLDLKKLTEQLELGHRKIIEAYEKTITDKQRERMQPL
ncbi:MAG: TIGR04255 family protein [Acidobacteria bacterium]|nr:TIGR04255 family protein [Acidobacteriota bacterium]